MSIERKLSIEQLRKSLAGFKSVSGAIKAIRNELANGDYTKNPKLNPSIPQTDTEFCQTFKRIVHTVDKIDTVMADKWTRIESRIEERREEIQHLEEENDARMIADSEKRGSVSPEFAEAARSRLLRPLAAIVEEVKQLEAPAPVEEAAETVIEPEGAEAAVSAEDAKESTVAVSAQAQVESVRQEPEIDETEALRQELEDMMMLATGVHNRSKVTVRFQTGEEEVIDLGKEVIELCHTICEEQIPQRVFPSPKAMDEYNSVIRKRAWERLQKLLKEVEEGEQKDFSKALEKYPNEKVREATYLLLTWLYERKEVFGGALESFLFGRDTGFYGHLSIQNRTMYPDGGILLWLAPETLTRDQFLKGMAPKVSSAAITISAEGQAGASTEEQEDQKKVQELLVRWKAEQEAKQGFQQPVTQEGNGAQEAIEKELRQEINACLDRLILVTRDRNGVEFSWGQIVHGNFISGFIHLNLTNFQQAEKNLKRLKLVEGIHRTGRHYSYRPEAIPIFDHYTKDRNTDTLKIIAQLSKEEVAKRVANNGKNGKSNTS